MEVDGITLWEERPGYYCVRRTHPITGTVIVKKSRNVAALTTWAKFVELTRGELKAGAISRETALQRLAMGEGDRKTVQEAWEEYFPTLKTDGTKRAFASSWEHHLKAFFGALHITEVTKPRLDKWYADECNRTTKKGKKISQRTIANAWHALRAALNKQIDGGSLARLPCGDFAVEIDRDAPLERELLRDATEMLRLIEGAAEADAYARSHGRGARFGDLAIRVAILVLCGLRQGELGGAGWDDVRKLGEVVVLRVRHQVKRGWRKKNPLWERPEDPPKNKKTRDVPLTRDAMRALKAQKEALWLMGPCLECNTKQHVPCEPDCKARARGWFRPDGPIFPGKNGDWRGHPCTIKPPRLRELVRVTLPEIDADRFVVHSLRHTFASAVYFGLHGDTKRAMRLTGHRSAKVFDKYVHAMGRSEDRNPLPELGVNLTGRPLRRLPAPAEPAEFEDPREDEHGTTYGLEDVETGGLRSGFGADDEPEDDEPESDDVIDVDAEVLQVEGAGPVADVLGTTAEKARAFEARRVEERRVAQNNIRNRYRAKNATDYETAYRGWVAAGRPGIRPFQVTAAMEKVYDRERRRLERQREPCRYKVPRGVRTWEGVVRALLNVPQGKPVAKLDVEELRGMNDRRTAPPTAGNVVMIPARWEGQRRGRKAKARVLGSWMAYLKSRDAAAALSTASEGQLPAHAVVEEPGEQDEEGDDG